MKYLIVFLFILGCGHKKDDPIPQRTADSFEVMSKCQLQSVRPSPNHPAGVSIKTYLCSQFNPSCLIEVLSSPAHDQVPYILSNSCPDKPPFGVRW